MSQEGSLLVSRRVATLSSLVKRLYRSIKLMLLCFEVGVLGRHVCEVEIVKKTWGGIQMGRGKLNGE